eukprot:TRINITY_DN1711_c0_g1_i10.p1 TRINITY_DN1711_c0_g1~~TRINITY_DN1711_c0_g1_i10.p1  ORF type:complete len:123 (+),score=21.06 TRINITY_DN1711_c0_g1_i10:386-754(+)
MARQRCLQFDGLEIQHCLAIRGLVAIHTPIDQLASIRSIASEEKLPMMIVQPNRPGCVPRQFQYFKARLSHIQHVPVNLSLIHISEPTRLLSISYAVFCLKKKKKNNKSLNINSNFTIKKNT